MASLSECDTQGFTPKILVMPSLQVTRGNCLQVEGTDLGERECIRYDCQDTQGSCPPEGYPVCDG